MTRRAALILALLTAAAPGQIPESATDPNGVAIPYPLVHLMMDPAIEGSTGWLRQRDPFLLYQLGRDLTHRQYSVAHGALGQSGRMSVPLDVGAEPRHGADARFGKDHAASCGMCHSMPYREPGAGQTIPSTGGRGRNTPHFYGAGLMEMIARQVEAQLRHRYDRNGNGRFEAKELGESAPARIAPVPGAAPIDFGDLAPGPDGVPRLNSIFRLWFTDAEGHILPEASGLNEPGVVAFGFAMQPFGWGRGLRHSKEGGGLPQGAEAATLREIFTIAADAHMGLQAYDPAQQGSGPPGAGGPAKQSRNGAPQFDFGGSIDRGRARDAHGVSRDDPDGDGHVHELSEGDLDAIEFYMLHAPPPAILPRGDSQAGAAVLAGAGCVRCHVPDWRLEAADPTRNLAGDRRFFDMAVTARDGENGSELIGRLERLARQDEAGRWRPNRGEFLVQGIYTDFKHWDIGPAFHERRFDGRLQRQHRTAPLWGVADTAPYGHDGRYSTLHAVIAAHDGAAKNERDAYMALSDQDRARLLAFLESLVLYQTEEIPADIDGDGQAAATFEIAGQDVGYERFDARFLFATTPRWRILGEGVNADGRRRPLGLLQNVEALYRLESPGRRDTNGDGFPDRWVPLHQEGGHEAP